MIDSSTLPEQFSGVPADLNRMQSMQWRMWMNGHIPSLNELQSADTKDLYERYRAQNGRSDLKSAVADKLRAEASIRRIAMQNPNRVSLNQSQVTQAVKTSLDVFNNGETKPAVSIVRDLLPGKDVKPVMNRPQQRKRMKKAMKANAGHPAIVTAQKQGNPIRMDADTLSSGLASLQNAAMVVRKLYEHEKRLGDMESRLKELEAFKANTEKRHAIEDSGQTPEQRVLELRKQGLGYKAISTATGTSQSTVRNWIKAHGL